MLIIISAFGFAGSIAIKAAKRIPVPNVYYKAQDTCRTLPYSTNLSGPGASFTITTTVFYTLKLAANFCTNPISPPRVVERTSAQ